MKWLFSHVDFFSEMIEPLRDGESYRNSENIFFSFYKILCELFLVKTDSHSSLKSDSLISLVERNISYLDNILLVSDEHEKKIKKIKYMQHKSQYQFDNLLKNLLGNESEHA
ncbi:hypothetical protein [Desulfuromonas thiophila]|uniref:hypothetical protein n=1 Tax=Desulfuromonas thiophila TaxID=57664 RepID=UPI00115FB624|nr:hypothetical protein [Desulfuromonas thiophila]